jgi:hypothetical protein
MTLAEIDLLQGGITAAGAGFVTGLGWLLSKLWGAWRHEIRDMKMSISAQTTVTQSLSVALQEHMQRDQEVQLETVGAIRELTGYLRGQHRIPDKPLDA